MGGETLAATTDVGRRQTQPPPKTAIVYFPGVVEELVETVNVAVAVPKEARVTLLGLMDTLGLITAQTGKHGMRGPGR